MLLRVEQAGAVAEPRSFLFLLILFLHLLQEVSLALAVLTVLNPHVNSLGKNLALNLLIYTDAHRVLDDIIDSPGFAMVTLKGHSSFEQ